MRRRYSLTLFALIATTVFVLTTLPALASVAPSDPDLRIGGFLGRESGAPSAEGASLLQASVRNETTTLTYASIDAAVAAATAGDTLTVLSSILVEGFVHIDKSLTLRGDQGFETVIAGEDTGSVGDARAWFLVDTGVDLTVEGLTFDGSVQSVYQAFRHRGTGSFDNCTFRNIQYGAYQGTAIVAFGGNVDVTNCLFSSIGRVGMLAFGAGVTSATVQGNTYFGKGVGDQLDYAFEVGAGANAVIVANFVSNCLGVAASDGSASGGTLVSTVLGAGTSATVNSNTFVSNHYGIAVGAGAGDSSTVQAAFNRMYNLAGGSLRSVSTVAVQAENNWWGCNGGLADPDCGPTTGGTGTIDADPWLVLGLTASPATLGAEETAFLDAELNHNSDGADVSALGNIQDDTVVDFAGDSRGFVSPTSAVTTSGIALSQYTTYNSPGIGFPSATVDNATVSAAITIDIVGTIFFDGFESGDTSAWQ